MRRATARTIADRRFGHDAHVARLAALVGPPADDPGDPPVPPQLDLAPSGHRHAVATTLVVALEVELDEVETLIRALDRQRRHAPGFVPVVVITLTRPSLADELGIETRVVTRRRNWSDTSETWEAYAQRRVRQLGSHYGVDNVTAADPAHPDAWIALQVRPPSAT